MVANLAQAFSGWSFAQFPAECNISEIEFRQGKNSYLVALAQMGEFGSLAALASRIMSAIPKESLSVCAPIGFVAACGVGMVVLAGAALVVNGHIPAGAQAKKICRLISENAGTVIRVATLVTAVVITIFVNPYYGGSFLLHTVYHIAHEKELVSEKVSYFMRTYVNTLTMAVSIPESEWLVTLVYIQTIGKTICPSLLSSCCMRIDALIRSIFFLKGNAIADYMAPLEERRDMSYEEIKTFWNEHMAMSDEKIQAIFIGKDKEYRVNPAHCSKSAIHHLETSTDFDNLLVYFDSIKWMASPERANIVKNKLFTDQRFKCFIGKQCIPPLSEDDKKDLTRPQLEVHVRAVSHRRGMTPEACQLLWLRRQMEKCVMALQKQRLRGFHWDQEIAIEQAGKIMPYLRELFTVNPEEAPEEALSRQGMLEDVLLKLAVEGGGYCAAGLKGAMSEQVTSIIQQKIAIKTGVATDGPTEYERSIRGGLQSVREDLAKYDFRHPFRDRIQRSDRVRAAAVDRHVEEALNIDEQMKNQMGFVALAPGERDKVSLGELSWSIVMNRINIEMYDAYCNNMYEALVGQDGTRGIVGRIGNAYFFSYINNLITSNTALSEEQQNNLLRLKRWRLGVDPAISKKFIQALHLYMLVTLGILEKKKASKWQRVACRVSVCKAHLRNKLSNLYRKPVENSPLFEYGEA